MMHVRFLLSLGNVEGLLFERDIDICHEIVRLCWNRFGPMFSADIRRRRVQARLRFRRMMTLQKFASTHASILNRFNQERHLNDPQNYKQRRSAVLADRTRIAACGFAYPALAASVRDKFAFDWQLRCGPCCFASGSQKGGRDARGKRACRFPEIYVFEKY